MMESESSGSMPYFLVFVLAPITCIVEKLFRQDHVFITYLAMYSKPKVVNTELGFNEIPLFVSVFLNSLCHGLFSLELCRDYTLSRKNEFHPMSF